MSKFKELLKKVEDMNKEIRDNFEVGLKESAMEIFNKHPQLQSFCWIQYTPYFNDGEPCEFSIHADEPGYVYGDFECSHYESAIRREWDSVKREYKEEYLDKEAVKAGLTLKTARELEDEISDFTCSLYSFGNHVQAILGEGKVIVTREGVEVEHYDHD